jgi:hypothetical protein
MFSGEYTMTLLEENPEKNCSFTCPNISCGKTFTEPLKAINLQEDPDALFDACPYCLTKIDLNDIVVAVPVEETRPCQHHLGFLYEREKKTDFPDECMLCKDIVACMLSKVKQ